MKFGHEVEGRLAGIPTIFCDAKDDLLRAKAWADQRKVTHIYISDGQNILSYEYVARILAGYTVTLDVTERRDEELPANIIIMLRLPDELYWHLAGLRNGDQIKFERNRYVYVFTVGSAMTASPVDFNGDVDLFWGPDNG